MATTHLGQHGDTLDDLELARRINGQLRSGEVRLDFAGVLAVSRPFAEALLDGLDLGRVVDDLGS